ncbi:30S ribosomal protein S11 [Candidatus Roizmanbacteria bacterium RIFCSPHIGHO2_02_FULL_40_13b]|uniref:Small ribosomal subunit protein uS11 n=1 Tax=Candidatus Roizmanbacteria bacterium RIFCSPHIGHO2_01_FULL_39_24 TaxID=1802032 RepID=A0A1F7GLA3_9BACT|nr:MAG: 30S ribosomal protein S11 [Candidatus Roizmanbacteria bacterium RIFCSPHIGHO2_01_FULL_39_24]OGK27826.1 MAG: 30S ribosomal protein S11 [Candidatus Roizmanbacteria bacterium RIFCSPHIGHO2_02_FULL_40_13b]OGK49968.1 MAG: 30S ribosomal protein S11 [Candidatus Roizmanbacteria bacterium RIFCSPLOWO2_01_FULL_40_32]OGK55973.1 MAG: 30S ribosomal protein S11 [Candidatus Roizmanbacteria bacterium RIFCSPLOWO2_02_FULL_39_8]
MAKKTKEKKQVRMGRIYVSATFNNTVITITDEEGHPLAVGSCGMFGFSGTRKSTPYAATTTIIGTLKKVIDTNGFAQAVVYVKGIGPGREASIRAIRSAGIEVDKILDVTPIPHNGVRPPKERRG